MYYEIDEDGKAVKKRAAYPKKGPFQVVGDSELTAVDRLVVLMKRPPNKQPRETYRRPWEHEVDAAVPGRIVFPIYYSTQIIRDHGPARNHRGEFRDSLESWPLQFVDLPDLSDAGFPTETRTGKTFYTFHSIMEVIGCDQHLDVIIKILKPGLTVKWHEQTSKL